MEKEDSDTESNHNYSNSRRYRDSENSDNHTEKRVNININTSIMKSPAKTKVLLKKVDLGAAANFGKDESQNSAQKTNNNLLNDDFDPRSGESKDTNTEFGDFETAFGDKTQKQEDNFADFSSAFSSPQNINNEDLFSPPGVPSVANIGVSGVQIHGPGAQIPPQILMPPGNQLPLVQNNINLIGQNAPLAGYSSLPTQPNSQGIFGPAQGLAQTNIFGGVQSPPTPIANKHSSGNDLFGDLSGFSSLNLGSQTQGVGLQNGGQNSSGTMDNLLDDFGPGKYISSKYF